MVNLSPVYPPPGTYVVVKTGGFGSWCIRRGTHSWANHAFIVVDTHGTIVEAEPRRAQFGHISQYHGCRMAFNAEALSPPQALLVCSKAKSLVGVHYNEIDIFNLGLESLGIFWKALAQYASEDGELICSQLVAVCGMAAGLNWLCGKSNPAEVTPGDLAKRAQMRPYVL